jgi:hypothetical protein
MTVTPPISIRDAALQRTLSTSARRSFVEWLVKSHMTDVNGYGDRLRYLQRNPKKARPNEARGVLDQCGLYVEAIALLGESAVPALEVWATEHMKQPEDAFALGFAAASLGSRVDEIGIALAAPAQSHAAHGSEVAAMARGAIHLDRHAGT